MRLTPVISIVSGKGGVGKSLIAVNLAEALVSCGRTVALLDADADQTACATLMNEVPRATAGAITSNAPASTHACASGVSLAQHPPATAAAATGGPMPSNELTDGLEGLADSHEVVLIDAPSGVGDVVRACISRSDVAVLVVSDEPTAVADAYRLAKATWQDDPGFPFGALVNFAESDTHGRDVWHRFSQITRRFTGNAPFYLGWVPFSSVVRRSVASQRLFVRDDEVLAHHMSTLAQALLERAELAARGVSTQ